MIKTVLTDVLAPSFYKWHKSVKRRQYTHYWNAGGRGSTKSSADAIEVILTIMSNKDVNGLILRKVANTLADSVFEQLLWAINKLGVTDKWHVKRSPLELTYKSTGQKILFRGADDPVKLKSIKVSKGYIGVIWFEELVEFCGMEEIRSILQSVLRGGPWYIVLYSYNPPKSKNNWVNKECKVKRPDRLIHKSDYRSVDPEWLGQQFILEAQLLLQQNELMYRHEYLGEITGTTGEVFKNITLRPIDDSEIRRFDHILRGLDFGYALDPAAYLVGHYDAKNEKLYLFYEVVGTEYSNSQLSELIKKENITNSEVVCDSAEPKSIRHMKELGVRCRGAKKGPDSVQYGINFLQNLAEIIIDDTRCPVAAAEFENYEYAKTVNEEFKSAYVDKNNHTIDATRYMLEDLHRKGVVLKKLQH